MGSRRLGVHGSTVYSVPSVQVVERRRKEEKLAEPLTVPLADRRPPSPHECSGYLIQSSSIPGVTRREVSRPIHSHRETSGKVWARTRKSCQFVMRRRLMSSIEYLDGWLTWSVLQSK